MHGSWPGTYIGMIKNNMANGIGRYFHDINSSNVYEGFFVNNKKEGFGRYAHPDY